MTKFYIQATDLVTGFIGPFDSALDADDHIENIMVPRGDGSTNFIITDQQLNDGRAEGCLVMTPAEDIELAVDPS